MTALYAEHTAETGQTFTAEALERAWELSRGQPWLVNALGYETCFRLPAGRDRSQPITAERLEDHVMHEEFCAIDETAIREIETAKLRGGRVIAVGTTAMRTLESAAQSGSWTMPFIPRRRSTAGHTHAGRQRCAARSPSAPRM